jgi:nitrogen fixation/metabolism regulation signal transduction histidine kinase
MIQTIQRLLHNPMALKLALATVFCLLLFAVFAVVIRGLRKNIAAESEIKHSPAQDSALFTLSTYQGVIQQLREQDKAVRRTHEQDQAQAAIAETINESVLANLNSGVLFFDRQALVRQANRAAKSLLGYASPFSFHARDLFRGISRVHWPETGKEDFSAGPFLQALQHSLQTAESFARAKIDYLTPGGQKRVLGIQASPVCGKNGEVLGLACVINDLTEIAELSRQAERNENLASLGEISAGLVNDFKKSLALIAAHAEGLIKEDETEAGRYYAERILAEAESLSRIVSEFLDFANSTK